MAFDQQEITDHIADQIEEALLTGASPRFPWHHRASLPKNLLTGSPYTGANAVRLWTVATMVPFVHDLWATVRVINEAQGSVVQGQRSPAKVCRFIEKDVSIFNENGRIIGVEREQKPRWYSVFNIAQTTLEPAPRMGSRDASDREADNAFRAVASVTETSAIPAFDALVNEIGAAFLLADNGLSAVPRNDHAVYMRAWLAMMKRDSESRLTLWTAASLAGQAIKKLKEHSQAIAA